MKNDGTGNVRQGLLLLVAATLAAAGIILASGYALAQGSAAVARPARAPRPAPATPLEMALRLERELARGAGILMPDPERPVRLDGGLIPLNGNRGGFPAAFLDGLVHETRNGVDVWRAVLRADDTSGDMLFYNASGEHFWTVPANAGIWSADWIARLHTPDGRVTDFFSTEQRYQELRARPSRVDVPDKVHRRSAWFNTRQYFRPSRVEMTFTFILQDDLADYRSTAAAARAQATTPPQRSPAALTGLSLTGIACGTNGVTLSAAWPTNTVISGDALDIFFSRSLLPQAWTNRWWAAVEPAAGGVDITIPQSDLPPVPDAPAPACFTNTAPSAYDPGVIYTNIVCTNAVRPAVSGFFRLADLADTDSDGLTDAAETWTHGTNPGLADTDGDGMPDGWEVLHGFDPLAVQADGMHGAGDDPDNDGLANLDEYLRGTEPFNPDTDGDGLPDGTEEFAVLARNAGVPAFDVSGGTVISTGWTGWFFMPPGTNMALPFPVVFYGYSCTSVTVSANGLAGLNNEPAGNGLLGRLSDSRDMTAGQVGYGCPLVVAGFWDRLRLFPAELDSAITLADVTTNGARYCVVEYRNMGFTNTAPSTNDMVSFQIVFKEGVSNRVSVLFQTARGRGTGAGATLGAQAGMRTLQYAFHAAGSACAGLELAYIFGTDPLDSDTDGDGLDDGDEVNFHETDPLAHDTDGDGLGDGYEVAIGTSPTTTDTDGDGLPDGWEVRHGFDPIAVQTDGTHGAGDDPDGDGLTNLQEYQHGTEPFKADTDGDGLADGEEITLQAIWPCLDPLVWDSDGDMLPDGWEVRYGLSPCVRATPDSPNWDSDGDGLGLFDEYRYCTSPLNPDTDGDGVNDGDEIPHSPGSCPNDASDNGSPTNCVTLKLTVGDPSGSHSERWNLDVFEQDTGRAVYHHCDAGFGTPGSTNYALVKGKSYTLRMRWIATNLGSGPDFDWQARINDSTAAGVYEGLYGTGAFIVEDPDTLLADETHGDEVNITIGREGRIIVPKLSLVPDYDRDGVIGDADRARAAGGEVFRLWINDDRDVGNTTDDGGADIPGQGSNADHADYFINGRRDLTDLFPVLVGVAPAITGTGAPLLYRIRQAGGAVSFIYTSLANMNANWHQTHDITGCGAGLDTPLLSANITLVSADGIALSDAFVQWLPNIGGRGVILVEGKASSSAPLILDAVLPDGTVVASAVLPMRVAPVEQMYTRVNLRDGAAVVTPGTAMPPAASGKNAIFVHGFNVTEDEARGWHSEVFRRLWQSGSNTRFHAVTWKGDINWPNVFFYHGDVASAFQTAPHLKDYVAGLTGQKIIMAQSLGNLVVSSAIADHGMGVDKYFMLNAAVPSEAHDAGLWSDSSGAANRMVHDEWRDYTNICWSAKWHEFFAGTPSDDRGHLTWKNRLGGVLAATTTYNIYSTGDQVFELRAETPPTVTFPLDRYTWQKQETHKGRGGLDPAGTSWAGWAFAEHAEIVSLDPLKYKMVRNYSVASANAATPGQLRDSPVFRRDPSTMFTNTIPVAHRNELLAKAIPALSPSAGNTAIAPVSVFNFDMNTDFKPDGGVWGRDHGDYGKRWLHNDMREMAFFYTHKLFKHLVVQGDLQ